MARVMQAASFLLMAGITWANAKAFRYGGDDLGYIGTMITEENYGLGLYVGIGVFLVLMGAIWCLWILSGKHAGGKSTAAKIRYGARIYPVYNHPCSGISSRSGSVPDAEECGQLTADCRRRLCGTGGDQCEPRISAVLQHRRPRSFRLSGKCCWYNFIIHLIARTDTPFPPILPEVHRESEALVCEVLCRRTIAPGWMRVRSLENASSLDGC